MIRTSKGYGIRSSSSNQKRSEGAASRSISGRFATGGALRGQELYGVSEREIFDYLVHRREVEKLRPSTLNQAVVALRIARMRRIPERHARINARGKLLAIA